MVAPRYKLKRYVRISAFVRIFLAVVCKLAAMCVVYITHRVHQLRKIDFMEQYMLQITSSRCTMVSKTDE